MLRFVAFLLVFVHHSSLFSSGWLKEACIAAAFGLPLFFFLSAYLITELLDREYQSTGTIRLGAFYTRRILRIWPLYFAALLVDFFHAQFSNPATFTPTRLIFYLLLAGNWYTGHHGFVASFTLPLWSISVEEQFYLAWPSVRRVLTRPRAIAFCFLALALSFVALYRECQAHVDLDTALWVNSFVQFQFFATGALVALRLRGQSPSYPAWLRAFLFAAGLLAFFVAQNTFHAKAGMPQPIFRLVMPGYLLVNLGCIAVFLSFLGAERLARAKPLAYLGKVSYGLYVFHLAMLLVLGRALANLLPNISAASEHFMWLRACIALPATILVASLSYRFFEQPILRFKQRFEVIRSRPA